MGKAIEPAVRPLGWDWRIGCAVIASFPAREVVVATLGVVYGLGEKFETKSDESRRALGARLQHAVWDGTDRPVFTLPVALSIMVFFALCCQCAATLAVIRRETNSWRWPAFAFTYMTTLAYVGGVDYLSSGNVDETVNGRTRHDRDCVRRGGGGLHRRRLRRFRGREQVRVRHEVVRRRIEVLRRRQLQSRAVGQAE